MKNLNKFILTIGVILCTPLMAYGATEVSWRNMKNDAVLDTYRPSNTTSNFFGLDLAQVITPGNSAYIIETGTGVAQNNYSKVLLLSGCREATLRFHPNVATNGAGSNTVSATARGQAFYCAGGTGTVLGDGTDAPCYPLTADINDDLIGVDNYQFTGDPGNASTDFDGLGNDNRGWIQGIQFNNVQVRIATDPPNNITSAFIVDCLQ